MTGASERAVLDALRRVVRDQGWDVTDDPARLRGMLNDLLGAEVDEHRGVLDAVVVSAREGVPDAVRVAGPGGLAAVRGDLVAELEEWGLTPERAAWVVDSWAGLAPVPTVPPPATAVPPPAAEAGPTASPVEPGSGPTAVPEAPAESDQEAGPAPAESPPTALPPPIVPPTTLPPPVVAGAADDQGAAASESPTAPLPADVEEPSHPPVRRARPSRALALAAVAAVVIAGAGVAGAVALAGGDDPENTASETTTDPSPDGSPSADSDSSSSSSPGTAPSEPPEARGDELVAAPGARPEPASGTFAMAARSGGVRIAALSDVDRVGQGDDALSPPRGGRLIAFRLARWRCDGPECRDWSELGLRVAVGNDVRPLPDGPGTYVVAVPDRSAPVDLVMRSDGYRQTLSLRNGRPGKDNIAVLARADRTVQVEREFTLTDVLSTPLEWPNGQVSDSAPRLATLRSARLGFFGYSRRPATTRQAILAVDLFYTRPWDADPAGFFLEEVTFRDADGTEHEAFDVDPDPERQRLGFEVPADTARGVLVFGATVPRPGYTQTLLPREVPLRFP